MPREIDRIRVQRLVGDGAQLLEVLLAKQYEEKGIAGAVSPPLPDIPVRARELPDRARPGRR